MKILLWIGNDSNQKALVNKLAKDFDIVGIVIESRKQKRKITMRKVINYFLDRLFFYSINKAWWGMLKFYENKYPKYAEVPIIYVENINNGKVLDFTNKLQPDLIVVSGTRMIKKDLLSIKLSKGILNLHTGLSPYIKGGPNCTNWCIATNQFHLVGNTIMWIDEGIDSGNIVTTDFVDIDWKASLLDIHIKVMEHAHFLYYKAIKFIEDGGVSNIAQSDIAKGTTYYTKDWQIKEKIKLLRNLKKIKKIDIDKINKKRKNIEIVKITLGNTQYKKLGRKWYN